MLEISKNYLKKSPTVLRDTPAYGISQHCAENDAFNALLPVSRKDLLRASRWKFFDASLGMLTRQPSPIEKRKFLLNRLMKKKLLPDDDEEVVEEEVETLVWYTK